MERVLGLGGVLFKAQDSATLSAWYRDILGIELGENGDTMFAAQAGDQTAFSLFPATTDYFGTGSQMFMLNFRVRDLDAILAQARAAGAVVDPTIMDESYGKFGWVTDPEGNRIELWQVQPDDATPAAP